MNGALLALLAGLLAGIGSRKQLLVAAQTVRGGRRVALLPVLLTTTLATCVIAAVFGGAALGLDQRARDVLSGFCLILAALALAWRSGGAIADPAALPLPAPLGFAAILLLLQVNGPLPLVIVAIAAEDSGIAFAAIGGTLGALLPLLVAWELGDGLARWPMAFLRRAAAGILGLAGLLVLWPTVAALLRGGI